MVTHSSTLDWRLAGTKEPGELQSMGSQRVGHDWSDLADTHSSAHFTLFPQRKGLPWWLRGWNICLQCGRPGFDPWITKIPWRRKQQSTPVPLPGERIPWMTNPTLGDPMDYSPPGSSVRGILHGAMNKTDPSSCGRFSPKPCTGSLLRRSARGLSIDLICLSLFILPVILTLPLISVSGLTDWNMYFHALRLLSGCRELHQ